MKLHIGGESKKEGWSILNIQQKPGVDFIGDINDLSQFNDSSCSEVYASHVVEHVKQNQIISTFKGIYRILIPDGKFYVSVPNMDILCQLYLDRNLDFNQRWHVMRMIFGGQVDSFDFHFIGWNEESLCLYLSSIGFSKIYVTDSFNLFEDTSNFSPYGKKISLNIIAIK